MFKVGDRGSTRCGIKYEVIRTDANESCRYVNQPIETVICGERGYFHSYDGTFNEYERGIGSLDLMPPDSNHYNTNVESGPDKEEVEMPEYLPEEVAATSEYEYNSSLTPPSLLEELADLSCRCGIQVDYDIGAGIVIFNRTSSAT